MISDSITPSAAAKDFGKKKRANRSAKLKQCKLDARREQWLSQGAAVKNKGCKDEQQAAVGRRGSHRCDNENKRESDMMGNLESRGRGRGSGEDKVNNSEGMYHDFDLVSPSNSPTRSSVLSGTDGGTNFTGSSASSSSSSSSTSSGGCCSGSISEEEDGVGREEDDDCLDDWEAVADALAADDIHNDNPCLESSESSPEPFVASDGHLHHLGSSHEDFTQDGDRPSRAGIAWKADDSFRPQSLPNLSKQRSFPNTDRRYAQHGGGLAWYCANAVNVPSSCPICCEELDGTDASFLPCICGFRLCLFCYNRIRQADGRCPGCRKNYEDNPVQSEHADSGGCTTFRLPRSYSMVARS